MIVKYNVLVYMKRLFIILFAAVGVCSCADGGTQVTLSDQNTINEAYTKSELAYDVITADSYDAFIKARAEVEKYEEAFRTQVGGEAYLIYLEECNYIFDEL